MLVWGGLELLINKRFVIKNGNRENTDQKKRLEEILDTVIQMITVRDDKEKIIQILFKT